MSTNIPHTLFHLMCHHEKVIFIKTLYMKLSLTMLKQEIKHVGQLFDKGWHN